MIRITVELCPLGDESKAQVIGRAHIFNNLTGTKRIGNYGYHLSGRDGQSLYRAGKVEGFLRLRRNVWDLLRMVLDDALEVE